MRTTGTLLATTLLSASLMAQGVITRISADGTYFYYDGNIQAALDELNPVGGDTVILGGGVYSPTTDLIIIRSDSAVRPGMGRFRREELLCQTTTQVSECGEQHLGSEPDNDAGQNRYFYEVVGMEEDPISPHVGVR